MNRVLKYPGAKWKIANRIIELTPEHHSYVEPFFGSGAVLFNKDMSNIETINDIDQDVINLFKVIRQCPEVLARAIALTPYSRDEYDLTFVLEDTTDHIEQARRFLVKCWQGHGFRTNEYKVGWKNDVQGRERMYAVYDWYRLPDWIISIADRLRQVQIENRPAIDVIKRFKYPNVHIYADPPYLLETRTAKQYKHEMTVDDHRKLLTVLKEHPGTVMISGYKSNLYDELLEDWHTEEIETQAEYGLQRIEILYMNYKPKEKFKRRHVTECTQLELFT